MGCLLIIFGSVKCQKIFIGNQKQTRKKKKKNTQIADLLKANLYESLGKQIIGNAASHGIVYLHYNVGCLQATNPFLLCCLVKKLYILVYLYDFSF
jgi:hypothetical protein